jgi:hypothetical protein
MSEINSALYTAEFISDISRLRIFLFFFLPWRWRRYVPLKRRLTPYLHGATSQKTAFFVVTAVKTSNLTFYIEFILCQSHTCYVLLMQCFIIIPLSSIYKIIRGTYILNFRLVCVISVNTVYSFSMEFWYLANLSIT